MVSITTVSFGAAAPGSGVIAPRRNARGRGFGSTATQDLVNPLLPGFVITGNWQNSCLVNHQNKPLSRTLAEPVAKEKLQRAVEPYMGWRQQGPILASDRDGRTETDEAVVDFVGLDARSVAKHRFGINREFTGINRRLRLSIENLFADPLAFEWRPNDGFERGLSGGADHALARCPNRCERDDIDLGANQFDAGDGSLG